MTQKWPKSLFLAKNARKLSFLPDNNVCTQILFVELVEATFGRFPENISQIARHFWKKVSFLAVNFSQYTASSGLKFLHFLSRKTVALHAALLCRPKFFGNRPQSPNRQKSLFVPVRSLLLRNYSISHRSPCDVELAGEDCILY